MAKLVMGPIVSRIAGKIGSITFRHNGTGASAYIGLDRPRQASQEQIIQRSFLSEASTSWQAQNTRSRDIWNARSALVTYSSPYAPGRRLSGRELYIRHWIIRRTCGQPAGTMAGFTNEFVMGTISPLTIMPGEPDGISLMYPLYNFWPMVSFAPLTGFALWMSPGRPLSNDYSAAEPMNPGPPPRKWFRASPIYPAAGLFWTKNIWRYFINALGGYPGTNPTITTAQTITNDIWVKAVLFYGSAIFHLPPQSLFTTAPYYGTPLTVYYPAVIPAPSDHIVPTA